MSRGIKVQKNKLLKVFIQYGIQIWLIIFISNVVVFFGFRYFLMASSGENPDPAGPTITIEPTLSTSELTPSTILPSPTKSVPTPTTKPVGPILDLCFSMPGISSIGGNIKPLHQTRNVDIYIYASEVNSADKKVKPLFKIKSKAVYDSDPNSPTYTAFVNHFVDLGKNIVIDSYYQIAIKTPQALMQIIKEPDSKSIGGKIFRMIRNVPIKLPPQKMMSGDIYPPQQNDDLMDMNDFKLLTNCFGDKAYTNGCASGSMADLDDNGVVDGLDYNLMLLSFRTLNELGYPIPTLEQPNKIFITPVIKDPVTKIKQIIPSVNKKPAATPTKIPVKKTSTGGSSGLIIFFIVFLIIIALVIFGAFKLHLLDKIIKNILKKDNKTNDLKSTESNQANESDAGNINGQQTAAPQAESANTSSGDKTIFDNSAHTETKTPETITQPDKAPTGSSADTAGGAEMKPAESQVIPTETSDINSAGNAGNPDGMIEKSGFLKIITVDDDKKGAWVTIADDTGITRGYYKGTNASDGFVKIKGAMKTDTEGKQYIEITQLTPEE